MVDYTKVPVSYMESGIKLWVESGIRPGSFMEALLANDMYRAFSRADHINKDMLSEWVEFIYNELPSGCHGSYEIMDEWEKNRG